MNRLTRITIRPGVCQGQPTIRGLRITISMILKQVAAGLTTTEILDAYPELEEDDIREALAYAAWLASERIPGEAGADA